MSGKRSGLVRDAFHHAAVAGDHINFPVEQPRLVKSGHGGEMFSGGSHADRGSEPRSERSGRDFDPFGMSIFRMTGSEAVPLAEALKIFHRQPVAEKMKQTVNQHGAVSGGEDKAIASEPVRVLRIVLEELIPEGKRDVSRAHRHTRMTRFCFLHPVRRKQSHGIRRELERFQV